MKHPDYSSADHVSLCRMTALTFGLLGLFLLVSCAPIPTPNPTIERISPKPPQPDSVSQPDQSKTVSESGPPLSLEDRMIVPILPGRTGGENSAQTVFSFRAQDMPLADALALFASANHLNIVAGPDITGDLTVDFHGLSLERAMAALLDAHGYYWVRDREVIRVRRLETRTFTLDYIRLVRSGENQSRAQTTSTSTNFSGSGSGGSGGQQAGSVTVGQEDQVKFWEELTAQIQAMLSKEGRMVINRLSGTIQVTDLHQRIKGISQFLTQVRRSLYRQVEIGARIYEVTLNDNYSLGIDWTKIDLGNLDDTTGTLNLSNIITAPFGGFVAKAATASLNFTGGSFEGVIQALREQGDLKVVSQPRLVTLNNQPALIKVTTDESFFTQTVSQGSSGTGNVITEQVQSVSVGLVLSVTPQISEDGWIMLDVTPIITRLREIRESPQKTATAPVVEVKQSSTLVRIRNGEMVIIGGLIQDRVSETERKVPVLGDIPVLGRLFKGTFTAKEKTELVIFLQPHLSDLG